MSTADDADIEQLIAEFQRSGLRELHVRRDDLEIYLSNNPDAPSLGGSAAAVTHAASAPPRAADRSVATPVPAPAEPSSVADFPDSAVIVRAPYLGTFYRSPKPGSDAYVEIGQAIDADTEICLVEVMKLFTAVRAGTAGTVHAILAKDGEMVAADQPLFAILPA